MIAAQSSISSITSTSTTSSATPASSTPSTQTHAGHAQPHTSEDVSRDAKVTLSKSELIKVSDSGNSVELIKDDSDELGV